MITVKPVADTNILEMEIDGGITAEEFDSALEQANAAIEQHGSIRMLEVIRSIETPPIPWSKFWDNFKFEFEHLSDITHAAVVADQGWIHSLSKLINPMFKMEIKAFNLAEIDQAREWLKNN
ncbi:SpoIIAA family protein [Rubinisphaera brasiliensis]|uniref:UspA domain-containing protein n=1 Tax=Rubinisphaera brasiliensis (strain ATCC 49424 / DSM 5305 / JCM 21570 / IAM 15109 / NBRC 103401 / IFAM 1448) TaxID=756272 RepID=F0SJ20_RUBBR|nr:STAS/SEC14 domain-containing protein [Rubinisphaera brasiliensis]ADY58562.1 hypothetical protein Plabr_0941 [Rubinisphaera brasiliensis DSM 5305]